MTTILPPARNPWQVIDQAIGQQVSQNLPGAVQQGYNRGLLQNSFQNLDPNANFIEQLKQIAPTLVTTPGGAQALGELAPVLGKYAQNQAYNKFIQGEQKRLGTEEKTPSSQTPPSQTEKPVAPTPEDYYRNPTAYKSPESLYPERSSGPQEEPESSIPQMQKQALDLMNNSQMTGNPISYPDAFNTIKGMNDAKVAQNARIRESKEAQKTAQKELTNAMVTRADNNGLLKTPEDRTVAEKFALEALRIPNENEQWQYVRSKMREYDNAKSQIQRSGDLAGPITSAYRKYANTYKGKQDLINDVQAPLKFYKDNGLYDEARTDLQDYVGLGVDDAERALFPLNQKQMQGISSFPKNQVKPKEVSELPVVGGLASAFRDQFPGEQYNMPTKEFNKFKENLSDYVNGNPGVNLVTLRSYLNQRNKYSWQDIDKAFNELLDERRFAPDPIQEQQMGVIKQPPVPGMMQAFQYVWTGAK